MKVRGLWGLAIEPSKIYNISVSASFRISMASINSFNGPERTSVFIEFQNQKFILCSLIPEKIEQQVVDITCLEGENVLFESKGPNCIHLTGNYVSPYDYDSADETSSESNTALVNNAEEQVSDTIGKHQDPSAISTINEEFKEESDQEFDEEPEESEEDEEEESQFQMSAMYDYFGSIQSLNADIENTQPDAIAEDEYSVAPGNTADQSAINKSTSGPTINEEEQEIIEIPSGQNSDAEFDFRKIHSEEKLKKKPKKTKKQKTKSEKEVLIDDKPAQSTEASRKKITPKLNEKKDDNSNNIHNQKASEKAIPKKAENEKTLKKATPKKTASSKTAVPTPKQKENPTTPSVVRPTSQQNESVEKPDTPSIPIPSINSSSGSSNRKGSESKNKASKKNNAKKDEAVPIPTINSSTNPANSKPKKNSNNKKKSSKTNVDTNKSKSKIKPHKPSTTSETTPPVEDNKEKKSDPKGMIQHNNKLDTESTSLSTDKEITPEDKLKKKESEALSRYPKRTRAPEFERTLKEMAEGDFLMHRSVAHESYKKRKKKLERSTTNSPSPIA